MQLKAQKFLIWRRNKLAQEPQQSKKIVHRYPIIGSMWDLAKKGPYGTIRSGFISRAGILWLKHVSDFNVSKGKSGKVNILLEPNKEKKGPQFQLMQPHLKEEQK